MDGVFSGESSDTLALELPAGEHHVAVSVKGHRVGYQTVHLVRGQRLNLRIATDASTQREVSLALMAGAGAALGVGIVLSAFAVRSENRAEDFLDARAHHNVDIAALIGYQASVNDRDRFRLASQVSLAGAAGLFITGLFLHELDQPSPQDRRRALPLKAERASKSGFSAIGFAPVAPTGHLGATLGVLF